MGIKWTGKAAGYLCRVCLGCIFAWENWINAWQWWEGGTPYSGRCSARRSSRRRNDCAERACICYKHTGLAFRLNIGPPTQRTPKKQRQRAREKTQNYTQLRLMQHDGTVSSHNPRHAIRAVKYRKVGGTSGSNSGEAFPTWDVQSRRRDSSGARLSNGSGGSGYQQRQDSELLFQNSRKILSHTPCRPCMDREYQE